MSTPLRMTTGRRIALAVGAPLAVLAIGHLALTEIAWAGQASYPFRLSIPMRSGAASIAVDSGQMRVGPGTGGLLHLTGIAHYSLVRSQVTWSSSASGTSVSMRCRFPYGSCSFDSRVVIMPGARAYVHNRSGDVTVRRLTGPVSVENDSGAVQVADLAGDVSITDHSGDITGSSLAGPRVVITANSGDISVVGLASLIVSASNDSGDVTLTFTRVPSSVRVIDHSGNITVVLPPGSTAYNVTASTLSGQRTVSVPTNSSSSHVITVLNDSGDVTVRS